MLVRLISPDWLLKSAKVKKVVEDDLTEEQIQQYNSQGYNVYYFPNSPSEYVKTDASVDGSRIDQFKVVFVDMDLKEGKFESKEAFIATLEALEPSSIVDSGNGIHAYWQVSDLDAKSYLRLSRRLITKFNTDRAVGKILQLMRLPNTLNTKSQDNYKACELLYEGDKVYTCEELSKALPPLTQEDEDFCEHHYNTTYNLNDSSLTIDDKMPTKFGKLLHENHEAKTLWSEVTDDRSKNDYRLGHIMFANGFTKDEAATVLANSAKAITRAPVHRLNYATNIISKIWTYELEPEAKQFLSSSVKDILRKSGSGLKGTSFRCHKRIDNTEHGFRLGHVIGLCAGSGVGKTAFALNMFKWFAEQNPEYYHFFIPLEQPANEIATRWQTMCGEDTAMHDKVHVMSNYDDDGNFRHLSLEEIQDYISTWQTETGHKVGCIVIDHIGALKKKGKNGENQDLMDICHSMKSFAVKLNALLVMQSQTSREKAGIGDLELNKDSAYGTMYFEAYCDYLITLWQPLKRCHHEENCPTVTAFKFCKIRHKKPKKDIIKEDVPYYFAFDSESECMKDMTQSQKDSFTYFLTKATNLRKADRKTDLVTYQSVPYLGGETQDGTETSSNRPNIRH